ncbi:SAM-dependent methyltransferase [Lysinibacillus composti]|uniref:Class I SAM-dependent methyltransferase n=1 Tax=Lysinibacillus composti TaxID=720633 RepID=A0A3N9UJ88_9BACI|nr:class I SAM-dependent methyltransferase [Lysinibacillus composti]MBM7607400.1 SAM-dependent methyltransferase [Lysinibacillus composti]RQW76044.1 class I SAM-dependent methyltransferase [Lysinibacillus composti]
MNEKYYEELMNIDTRGNKGEVNHSIHFHPYEPTPYYALEELFKHYVVQASDHIVDYGCGKGRLNFYIHHTFQAVVTGIEMNHHFYQDAIKNKTSYLKKTKRNPDTIQFNCCTAEEYEIQPDDNRFYFFNPFSVQVFMRVLRNILLSHEKHNRQIDLIFYYASDDYRYYLEDHTSFELFKEVQLPTYDKNPYERFLIYRLG